MRRVRLQTLRVTSRRIPIQLHQYLLLPKLASFSPNTSYLQHKCFEEPLPTTTKLRTMTKFLSRPVGCQDFDESSQSTGAPLTIDVHETSSRHRTLFFSVTSLLTPAVWGKGGSCRFLPGEFCFSFASKSQKKKSLKHTKTYFFLFFCTLFAKNGLFAI